MAGHTEPVRDLGQLLKAPDLMFVVDDVADAALVQAGGHAYPGLAHPGPLLEQPE